MKTILLSVLSGAIFGALVATAGQALSQSPSWYQLEDLRFEQEQLRMEIEDQRFQRQLNELTNPPYRLPCRSHTGQP